MPIVSTTITVGPAEIDGRKNVREVHTDHVGVQHLVEYLADPPGDSAQIEATAAEHKANLETQLPIQELDEIEQQLLAGENPFPVPPHGFSWNSRQQALEAMFNRLMARPVSEVIQAAGFLDYVDDDELAEAGFSDQRISEIRARVIEIKSAATLLAEPAFQP